MRIYKPLIRQLISHESSNTCTEENGQFLCWRAISVNEYSLNI